MILGNFVKWQGSIARNIGWLTNFSPINAHDKSAGSYLTQKRNGSSNYASEYAFEHSVSMKKTLLGWHFQLMKCTLRMFYVAFSAHNLKFRSVQPFLLLLKWNKWAKNKITIADKSMGKLCNFMKVNDEIPKIEFKCNFHWHDFYFLTFWIWPKKLAFT